jgi:hypothetical protein
MITFSAHDPLSRVPPIPNATILSIRWGPDTSKFNIAVPTAEVTKLLNSTFLGPEIWSVKQIHDWETICREGADLQVGTTPNGAALWSRAVVTQSGDPTPGPELDHLIEQ